MGVGDRLSESDAMSERAKTIAELAYHAALVALIVWNWM